MTLDLFDEYFHDAIIDLNSISTDVEGVRMSGYLERLRGSDRRVCRYRYVVVLPSAEVIEISDPDRIEVVGVDVAKLDPATACSSSAARWLAT